MPTDNTDKEGLLDSLFDSTPMLGEISKEIIGAAFKVSNALGCGFLEKVYENALTVELRRMGHSVGQQIKIQVMYEGVEVGNYEADLVVDGRILVELKAVSEL